MKILIKNVKTAILITSVIGASIYSANAACPKQISVENLRDLCRSSGAAKALNKENAGTTSVDTGTSTITLENKKNVCGEGTSVLAKIFRSNDKKYNLTREESNNCFYKTALGEKEFEIVKEISKYNPNKEFSAKEKALLEQLGEQDKGHEQNAISMK